MQKIKCGPVFGHCCFDSGETADDMSDIYCSCSEMTSHSVMKIPNFRYGLISVAVYLWLYDASVLSICRFTTCVFERPHKIFPSSHCLSQMDKIMQCAAGFRPDWALVPLSPCILSQCYTASQGVLFESLTSLVSNRKVQVSIKSCIKS